MRLSVVLPVFNEAENLEPLRERLVATLDRIGCDFELIFVDDGSSDESLSTIESFAIADPRVKFISLSRNFGHEVASTAGLDRADGDAVVLMDADLQDPPELIEQLLDGWLKGFDVVYATRLRRHGEAIWKRALVYAFYRVMRRVATINLPVDTGDYRLMDRHVIESLRQFGEGQRFVRGLVSWMGFRQTSVEYERPGRHAGQGKYGVTKLFKFGLDAILSFSIVPLRIATLLGCICVLIACGMGGLSLWQSYFGGGTGGANSFVHAFLVLIGGTQLLSIGVLGEYLGRTHAEVLKRPLYIVQRHRGFKPKVGRRDDDYRSRRRMTADFEKRVNDLHAA